jgi:hypothetical protein
MKGVLKKANEWTYKRGIYAELTRYVEEPATGARRYRPPRFAGPQY